jgi:hypothetical protein
MIMRWDEDDEDHVKQTPEQIRRAGGWTVKSRNGSRIAIPRTVSIRNTGVPWRQ